MRYAVMTFKDQFVSGDSEIAAAVQAGLTYLFTASGTFGHETITYTLAEEDEAALVQALVTTKYD